MDSSSQTIKSTYDSATNFLGTTLHLPHPSILIVGFLLAVVLFVRIRRKRNRDKYQLDSQQRASYLFRQWLNPVIELVLVGGVILLDLEHGWLQWATFTLGVAIGLPLGVFRGKRTYVGSVGKGTGGKVILERNGTEVLILVVLVAIKLTAHALGTEPNAPLNLVVVGLLGISIASSVGRVAYITVEHYRRPPIIDEK